MFPPALWIGFNGSTAVLLSNRLVAIQMHENKYLHLPVLDQSTCTVLGVVSVMEIIQATAGDRGSTR